MIGPGKYDPELTVIMDKVKAEGVLLIVVGGSKGAGFSAQGTLLFHSRIPGILRTMADQIEADVQKGLS